MEIIESNYLEYSNIINKPCHVFNKAEFANLNNDKVNKIYYLLFKDKKYRLGLIVGYKENQIISNFSAPFGGFSFVKNDVKISYIEDAINELILWAKSKNTQKIKFILPPQIYHNSFIAKQENVLYRLGFRITNKDLNYSFDLKNFDNNYLNLIWRNARKNFNIAQKSKFDFKKCLSEYDKRIAYEVIALNRKTRGFPLRLSWDQISETIQLIDADFFQLTLAGGKSVGAAIVFKVTSDIVQVIYWGDDPKYSELKTMNYLPYKVFEYYKDQNIKIVDVGPSTEDSVPNYGLCEFKEGIGCDIFTKETFEYNL